MKFDAAQKNACRVGGTGLIGESLALTQRD